MKQDKGVKRQQDVHGRIRVNKKSHEMNAYLKLDSAFDKMREQHVSAYN